MYKISVIMPVYNREKLVKRAVDSVINQSFGFENIELILVDDNSTDETKNVIKDYAEKYDNIHPIFRETNSGSPNIPRNDGIDNAKSEYIMFLDNDDEYTPEICEKLYNAIKKYKTDFVECWCRDISNYKRERERNIEENIASTSCVIHNREEKDLPKLSGVWNKLYKKSFLDLNNIRFPPNINAEDVFFSLLCYDNVDRWIEVKYIGYLHIDDLDFLSLSRASNKKIIFGSLKGLDLTINILKKNNSKLLNSPLEAIPNIALGFLRANLDYSEKNELLNKYWHLFKNYKNYDCLSLSYPMKVYMKLFTFDKKIAIIMSYIYKYLKLDSIFYNKKIYNYIRSLAGGGYNFGE
ncbi:putative glycosyltransferase EpsH [Methanobrevibacter cuticularis]|uniref:Putative glycosyltransferase EpsH n=1 Tax=Methanobrevibacter cuticularis TaxID=47311 RepID=A0A166CRH8_9EURY|nr:glycosyltransferase family 2 protein [Methanobrevibacter cuticularis]KZX14789.1 putative glycosyltransferase EpsH [Methanobrevibacter cuticularis]